MDNTIRDGASIREDNGYCLNDSIGEILKRAKDGEIKTLVLGTLERLCEDPTRRKTVIDELTGYGVEIITVFEDENISRRCAIYNRYSVDDPERLTTARERLISYCENELHITDYVLFEEVGSVLEKREQYDEMITRIDRGEFTDILVCHIDRLYKPAYSPAKFGEIVLSLSEKVKIHTLER